MEQHVLPGNPPVAVLLRKSARARRISLRVSQLDGRVTLTCPKGVSEREALDFAQSKAEWLRQTLAGHAAPVRVAQGISLPVQGRMRQVVPVAGRAVNLAGDTLQVPGPTERMGARVQGFLKQRARDRLAAASDGYAAVLGRPYARLTLRDTRSRWGSCTGDGGLMFSWRLIMAPDHVLDYVAAHEVAHLAEMNHSAAFWAVVGRLYGPHDAPRRWLRENGSGLHRYRFAD
ncbi:M48 family metallopeptidase [Lutimaribacter sp. EGI FJ00015]|uniref:M48 family metallopeptidase n=1 Tax=Lutimaribacter degradans TaxID=2945989 RepID=A0ACC5ZTT1_9RHOB|nr:SprT family zinc-dependent metalloprotease [Lutimaribacter sp. EGI FJ00013]MCM2561758.1 M48 family metallopeptidase [Lutimaribacter sp. EGI FJ00013]MCO0613210.1 M48 family metallopeptidase [Lutimaribacter sp. EGI FJ00015]MCO0635590.1 M48 family metallopeptidase [Lutimaribacter sp. EGI FJ00014]